MEFKEPLEKEEQERLFKEIKHNPQAKEKLILHNLKLVNWVAKKYYNPEKNEFDDLFQVGVIGLMKAIERFDPSRGGFSTYATIWIKQSIHNYIYNHQRTIRIPVYLIESIRKISKVKIKLTEKLDREPTIQELSQYLDMPIDSVEEQLSLLSEVISLDQELKDSEDNFTIGDTIEDKTQRMESRVIEKVYVENLLNYIKPYLSELEYDSIILFYGFNCYEHTLQEIAEKHGANKERVRQAKEKALRNIRRTVYKGGWKDHRERIIDQRTPFIKGKSFSNTKVNEGNRNISPVESIFFQRERMREEFSENLK